jgi:hypothetical protein
VSTTRLTTGEVLTLLAATPPGIVALTRGLSPAQLRTRPEADAWSANDVLAHLRSCADVWGTAMATLLAEDSPTVRAVNPTRWINGTDYPDLAFRTSLRAFTRQRTDLLALLEPLPPAAWERSATITGAGRPLRWSVWFYAQRMARHERQHLTQFEAIAAALA